MTNSVASKMSSVRRKLGVLQVPPRAHALDRSLGILYRSSTQNPTQNGIACKSELKILFLNLRVSSELLICENHLG